MDAERGSKIDQELRDVENVLFPRFQKRRLEKAQKKREARAVDRLEQELLKGSSFRSRHGRCGPHGAGPGHPTLPLGGPCGPPGSPPLVGQWVSEF